MYRLKGIDRILRMITHARRWSLFWVSDTVKAVYWLSSEQYHFTLMIKVMLSLLICLALLPLPALRTNILFISISLCLNSINWDKSLEKHVISKNNSHCICQHLHIKLFRRILSFHLKRTPLNRFHLGEVSLCLKCKNQIEILSV